MGLEPTTSGFVVRCASIYATLSFTFSTLLSLVKYKAGHFAKEFLYHLNQGKRRLLQTAKYTSNIFKLIKSD